jgi:hypothetical protein
MRAFEIQFTWQQLAQWVSLVEQWPYRVSYVIDACDNNPRVSNTVPLIDIYEKLVKCSLNTIIALTVLKHEYQSNVLKTQTWIWIEMQKTLSSI